MPLEAARRRSPLAAVPPPRLKTAPAAETAKLGIRAFREARLPPHTFIPVEASLGSWGGGAVRGV